ncbi:tyrosine-protein phosphatase [Bailinhaonella thermotolerans]|uniref:Tyrosine-protein phosphatase n=1 Tax=Bailinhaonella thermotolerans TaxID=1070861 RepID=A0A3A4AZA8_9ACTN|nr:tyrosine-protein phosphatase [Bailinhaonella thermotolerans]RJL34463.1 tyrosine-protein phosphatase [Bailinhaonella thermotolerans]
MDGTRTNGGTAEERHLDWEGCFNVRDLGGIPAAGGRRIRRGALVRSDNPDLLTPAGWDALLAHGVRTIVDLRNDDERARDASPRPPGVTTVHVPLDDVEDTELWKRFWDEELDGTPLYYRPFLDHKAERCVWAVSAVAGARPGGVLVHCGIGRDRTGLVTMLLLALCGVAPADIAADYELSATRLPPLFAALGRPDDAPLIRDILTRKRTSTAEALLSTLAEVDVPARLRDAGLPDADVAALRARLLTP